MIADVAILGAGPYGLATAAALRDAGITPTVLGRAMSFWEGMPTGMLLRSPYVASSIGDPDGPFGLDAFAEATATPVPQPVPLHRFVDYGHWLQRRAVPHLDPREVSLVHRDDGVFRLILDDGDEVSARQVIVAAGIGSFPRVPPLFGSLPPAQVSHASAHDDLSVFTGQRVLVIGAGQSALESAALLAENGAEVQIAARSTTVHWLRRYPWLRDLGPVSSLLYAPAEVGPPLFCHLVEAPELVRRLTARRRAQLDRRSMRPAGARWLHGRVVGSIPIWLDHEVAAVETGTDGVTVTFRNERRVVADHVLLGTGYRVELPRYRFLSRELLSQVTQADGYPVLTRNFESTVPGLHFIGAPAAWTFGPLMRFVAGTHFTAGRLRGALAGTAARAGADRVATAA